MRVYISGGISGKAECANDFSRGEMWCRLNGHSVINPLLLDCLSSANLSYAEYMLIDFRLIELCDCIYMLNGWDKSKGACAELAYAKAIGKKVKFESKQWALRNIEEVL